MIPFQVIDTRYGSSSILVAYALAAIFMLTGSLRLRMLPALGLIVLGYTMSLAMQDRDDLVLNLIAMAQFFSTLAVFLLAYNFARLVQSPRSVMDVLLWINVLVLGYCALQLTVGPGEKFTPFGIEAFAFNANRTPDDPRLIGAFGNPGSTAGYLTLATLICAVAYMFSEGRRKLLIAILVAANMMCMVATGNRTGILTLVAIFPAFLFVFRRELGPKRITTFSLGGIAAFVLAAAIAINFTDFDVMFTRMERVTETKEGMPSTRSQTWPAAIAKIKERPWFGYGPYYPSAEALAKSGALNVEFEDLSTIVTAYDPYPHSLYLYLLRTVGIVGLVPVVGFFSHSRNCRLGSGRGLLFLHMESPLCRQPFWKTGRLHSRDGSNGVSADSGISGRTDNAGIQQG
jgi:O-antigen ligase